MELQDYVDSLYPGLERKSYTLYEFLLGEQHALERSFALPLDGDEGGKRFLAQAKERRAWWRAAQLQEVAAAPGTLRQQPSAETRGRFADLFGGAGNSAVAAAQAGWECVALIEAHLQGLRLAVARLREYKQEPELYSTVRNCKKS